jgi:tetratricopeptide (TPR) repeat protein
MREQYFQYSADLSREGEFERALRVLDRLDDVSDFDAQAQFQIAKFSAESEFFGGGQYDEVEDAVQILILLNNERPFWFPEFGSAAETAELQILLNEIRIQRTRYQDALEFSRNAGETIQPDILQSFSHILKLHEGIALVYTFQSDEGEQILDELISDDTTSDLVRGRALHALGTSEAIGGNVDEAEVYLLASIDLFRELGDNFRLVRSLANLSLVYGARSDWAADRSTRREQEVLARQIDDKAGLVNALIGLAVAERNLGDYSTALAYASEAESLAREIDSPVAIAASLQNQANILVRQRDYGQALYAAKSALPYFLNEGDLRGIRTTLGVIGRAGNELGNLEDAVFGYFAAYVILSEIEGQGNAEASRDLRIYESHLASLLSGLEVEEREALHNEILPDLQRIGRYVPYDFDIDLFETARPNR